MMGYRASNSLAAREKLKKFPARAGGHVLDLKQWATALGRWWRRKPAPPQPAPQKDRSPIALRRPVPAGSASELAEEGIQVDDILKKRIKELGEAINQSLSESEPIADAIGRIKSEGYDVFLVLEATIGFTHQDEAEAARPAVVNGKLARSNGGDPKFRVTPQDLKFLKSMKIAVNE
jgi:hypothetical protein